jgi:hypothetical protein
MDWIEKKPKRKKANKEKNMCTKLASSGFCVLGSAGRCPAPLPNWLSEVAFFGRRKIPKPRPRGA